MTRTSTLGTLCGLACLLVIICAVNAQIPVRIIQSARDTGDRLTEVAGVTLTKDHVFSFVTVDVAPEKVYQEIFGFGGAFTEAAASVLSQLPEDVQQQVADLYFGPNGQGYTVGRIHMNSCDFSLGSWSYDDVAGDFPLTNFNTSHDALYLNPLLKRAMATSKAELRFYVSPWSPPAWMKGNGQMDSSSAPGLLNDTRVHQSWALFYSKYIADLKTRGVNVWGVTIQNEPENNASWESCLYTAEQERDFVRDYLGPQLRADHPEVNIMIWDHNKDDMVPYVETILSDPVAASFVDGVAFHWYALLPYFDHLDDVHSFAPNKFLFATEACNCPGVLLDDWNRGEAYGYDIIGDLQSWSIGWMDWNILLDSQGGPNHVGNYCDAPIIANVTAGTIHIQPPYYYMGHFSRFMPPTSHRIGVNGTMHSTGVVTPSGDFAVVVQNMANSSVTYRLSIGDYHALVKIPARGIQTLLIPAAAAGKPNKG